MKKLVILLILPMVMLFCGCTQNAPSPQNELTSSRWTAKLEGGAEVELQFYGEPGDMSADFKITNAGKSVNISGDCLTDGSSFVIFDESISQNFAFDYTPKGNTLDISYNGSTLTLQKQS